jgi:hypothetical protein
VASSFGVSSQCRAILNTTCDSWNSTETYSGYDVTELKCTKERAGLDFEATWYPTKGLTHFLEYHRFANKSRAFNTEWNRVTNESRAIAANLSREDGRTVFQNPWHWVAETGSVDDEYLADNFWYNQTHPYVWVHNTTSSYTMLLHCNTTGTCYAPGCLREQVRVLTCT